MTVNDGCLQINVQQARTHLLKPIHMPQICQPTYDEQAYTDKPAIQLSGSLISQQHTVLSPCAVTAAHQTLFVLAVVILLVRPPCNRCMQARLADIGCGQSAITTHTLGSDSSSSAHTPAIMQLQCRPAACKPLLSSAVWQHHASKDICALASSSNSHLVPALIVCAALTPYIRPLAGLAGRCTPPISKTLALAGRAGTFAIFAGQ
jgi:hypothetical protein